MAKAAMPLDDLEQWLRGRADRQPAATNLSMLDDYVTAIVAGPVFVTRRTEATSRSATMIARWEGYAEISTRTAVLND